MRASALPALLVALLALHVDAQPTRGFTASLPLPAVVAQPPASAPTWIAHAGPRFDPSRPFEIVLFLHGWSGCIEALMRPGRIPCRAGGAPERGWGLVDRADASDRNLLLLAPQLAYRARDASPGRLASEGYVRRALDEALVALGPAVSGRRIGDVTRVTVVAHSAGFQAALAVGRRSGLGAALERIALMDALYDVPGAFARWVGAMPSRSLVSLYTGGRTELHSLELARLTTRSLGAGAVASDRSGSPDPAAALRGHRVVVARVPTSHEETLLRYFPDVLARP